MVKRRSEFSCNECGYLTPRWLGRCPECRSWNSFEERSEPRASTGKARLDPLSAPRPQSLDSIDLADVARKQSGIPELDRVLGGGFVPGSVVLLGGDPGIGKSTLVLQTLGQLAQREATPLLYVSGEESLGQLRLRAERLGIGGSRIFLLAETGWERIAAALDELAPALLVLDSVQTLVCESVESAAGSVSQLRALTNEVVRHAKSKGLPTVLIGHVTKEGMLAGPRTLEHMVDTVLYIEGQRGQPYRVLRTVKNRFGSTDEIGVFQMNERGMVGVANPSQALLSERPLDASGSVVAAAFEGTRPLLVEIQALVTQAAGGAPRRTVQGVDGNRVALMSAILDKKAGLPLVSCDLFVNLTGGIRISEPALDLPIIAAMLSSFRDRALDPDLVLFGEVGLAGEVRSVSHVAARLREAEELGFRRCIVPQSCLGAATGSRLQVIGASHISAIFPHLFAVDRKSV